LLVRRGASARGIARVTTVVVLVLAASFAASVASAEGAEPRGSRQLARAASPFGIASGGSLHWLASADLSRELDGYAELGARWLRFDFNWSAIERERGVYDWSRHDAVIEAARARGVNVLGLIAYTPAWARPAGTSNKHAPTHVRDYADFVSHVVARYAPRGVVHWELWNEPNHANFWKPCPDVARYAELLKGGYAAVKAADPLAVVVSGGLSPAVDNGCNVSPRTFLKGLYAHGAAGSFDALGHHPYSFPADPGDPQAWSAWHQMAATSPSLRSIMAEHGDGRKQIWATEWGAKVGSVDEEAQARALARAYALFRSYSWAGPLFVYSYRDEDSFGLVRGDWSRRPAWYAFRSAARR
jgi:polysaccharide biosynthesis protein PslG